MKGELPGKICALIIEHEAGCKESQFYRLPFGQALASVYYTFQLAGKKILMSEQDWLQFFCNLNSPQNITCPSDKIHVHVGTEFKSFIAKSTTSGFWTRLICMLLNSLSPNIRVQILQSDLYTFPLRISWENLIKDQGIFSLVIILLTNITLSLANIWISLGESWCWSLLGLEGLKTKGTFQFPQLTRQTIPVAMRILLLIKTIKPVQSNPK